MGCGEGEVLVGCGSAADGKRGQVVGKGEFFSRSALFRVWKRRYDRGSEQGTKEDLGLGVSGSALLEREHLQSGTSPFPKAAASHSNRGTLKGEVHGLKPIRRTEIAVYGAQGH